MALTLPVVITHAGAAGFAREAQALSRQWLQPRRCCGFGGFKRQSGGLDFGLHRVHRIEALDDGTLQRLLALQFGALL